MVGRRMGGGGGASTSWYQGALRPSDLGKAGSSRGLQPLRSAGCCPQKLRTTWWSKGTGGKKGMLDPHNLRISSAMIWDKSSLFSSSRSCPSGHLGRGMGNSTVPPNST